MSVFSLSVQSGEIWILSNIMCFFILKWKMFLMISIIPLNFHHAYSVSFKFFLQLFYFLSFFIISPYKVSSLCVQDIYCWYIPVPTANFYPAPDIKERTYREMDCAFLDAHHVHNHHHKTQNWFETRIYSLVFCTFII